MLPVTERVGAALGKLHLFDLDVTTSASDITERDQTGHLPSVGRGGWSPGDGQRQRESAQRQLVVVAHGMPHWRSRGMAGRSLQACARGWPPRRA